MKLNKEKVKTETYYSNMHYEHLKECIQKYENDLNRKYRLQQLECKTCFYLKRGLAGQAFTQFECQNCGKEEHHPNTNVPVYCNECAEEHNCCVRCASEL